MTARSVPAVQQEALAHRATVYTVGILADDLRLLSYGPNGQQLFNELVEHLRLLDCPHSLP